MSPPESWSLSPPIRRLLLSVLALLPFLFGGSVHAQSATDPSVIDVAVFYTPQAKTANGWSTKQQAEAAIEALVTETNLAYTNSDVNQAIKLVAVEEVEGYIQATDTANKTGKNIDLDRLKEPSDGYMDDVHTVRDRVGADIVMLLRSEGGGQAFMMTVLSADSAVGAFGVSTVQAGLFAHEMGHIMGLAHDRYVNCMHDTDSPQCPTTVKPYAYGYVNQKMFDPEGSTTADPDAPATARWRTVMAYYNQCRDANVPGNCQPALLRFSNPNQRYPDPTTGDPMGKSGTRITTDVDGPADAARTLNETRTTVANFRPGRAVQVSFDVGPYAVNEGGSVTVTVRLDAAPGRTLDMPIPLTATSTDGAWPGDYTLPASITFGAGQTSKTFTFRAVQDTRQEAEETVILGFGAPLPAGVTVGSQATATVTLTANDADLHRASVPSVSTVAIISDPGVAYAAGEEIKVAVVFTKPIMVTGTPSIELMVGANTRQALCQTVASEVLTCTYTVVADESDTDGVSIAANSLNPNGGTIQDADNRPATDFTHAAVAANSGHTVDGDTPELLAMSGAVVDADTVTLTYDKALDETSIPRANAFTVTAGGATALITFVQVSGSVVTLTLVSNITHDLVVTLAYSPLSGTPPLQDVAGNAAADLSSRTLTNNTPMPIYDTDDDGLIEISTLAQLDAMRHDLNGDGRPTTDGAPAYAAAFRNVTRVVCGARSNGECEGYELMADLDFFDTNGDGQVDMDDDTNGDGQVDAEDNTTYWNAGAGWMPIGAGSNWFETTFEGNGYTISNLFVDRSSTNKVGLFGLAGASSAIRRVGLLDIRVTGDRQVGGLVGLSDSDITGSYATGQVAGAAWVGGLIGRNDTGKIHASYTTGRVKGGFHAGGLVGLNNGGIYTSYATGRVSGTSGIGGLVGRMGENGDITASYATGHVSGNNHAGGLVGSLAGDGMIRASYATGRVSSGGSDVGGLVGENLADTTFTASYWDTRTSGQTSSAGGTAKTTTELQTPTDYTTGSIYADWNVDPDGDSIGNDPWDFGTSSQYPVLKADFDGQGAATSPEFGSQLRVGPTLTVATDTGLIKLSWPAVTPHWTPPPDVTYTVYRNTGSTPIEEDLTDPEYIDLDVTRDIEYTYQVAAVVDGGEATRSELVTVTAPNQPPAFDDGASITRTIPENTPANRNIGDRVKATDPDDRTLTYSLDAASAAVFTITESTGQLRTNTALNYEDRSTYNVTVSVSDGKNAAGAEDSTADATIAVTITVTDVNEAPTFGDSPTTRSVAENTATNTATGQDIGNPVAATDPDTLTPDYAELRYRLSGSDAGVFFLEADSGQLRTREPLDHESRDAYSVTVHVRDGKDASGNADPNDEDDTLPVTINIVNVNEAGMVELLPSSTPQEKQALTATLSDPDGLNAASITWKWERSTDQSNWTDTGETSSLYTPEMADVNHYLRATATYTDGTGTERTESAITTAVVRAAPKVTLLLSDTDHSISEGETLQVTAALPGGAGIGTVEVRLTEMQAHYTLSGTTLTIPPGDGTKSNEVTLTAKDNKVDADDKVVDVRGTTTNTLVTAPDPVTLTITDNDKRGVTVSTDTLSIREEDTGEYAVKLNSEPTANVTVTITGHAGTDVTLTPSSATLTFTPTTWNRLQKVTVSTEHDADAVNDNVTLTHTARGGDYDGETATVVVTVTDNEKESTTVNLSVNPDTVTEGASRTVTVTGELDGAPRGVGEDDIEMTVMVTVMVTSGTATLDTDFTVADISKLTISEGRTSGTATFTLTTKDDNIYEPDETVAVSGTTTELTVTPTTLTIKDTDGPPTVTRLEVADASIPIREDGGEATVTVTLSHPSSSETVVGLTVPVGAAAVKLSQRELTIPAEATSGEVTLTAVGNAVDGAHQPVTVSGRVINLSGSRSPAQVQLTITDDDPPEVSGDTQKDYTEGDTGPVAEYTATNPADVQLEWLRAGPDATLFRIDRIDRTRVALHFRNSPDYEARADKNYQVTVQAVDTTSILGETLTGERTVTVTVRDAPGEVSLSSSQPRVGRVLTATVTDPDEVKEVTEWCWARSPFRDFPSSPDTTETCLSTSLTTTATYTPDNEDVNQYIRATATYTDSDETANKEAMRASAGVVTDRQTDSFRPPGNTGGGGGGGGGGAPACADDLHGNTAAQSTDIALSAVTAGAICPAADVDYFTVTAPGQGLVFVDTSGGVQTRGSIWQNDVVLASGPAGRPPDERLGARVQAGPVGVAVQGQGGATGTYAVEITFVQGYLENPGADSFQSGVGILSGWVCEAAVVEIELNGMPQVAAYGTERRDTASVCRDTDNGFGLLFNWNLLGDGEHTVVALVDGVELGRATVTVTTLGQEFLRDVTGTCEAADFPSPGERVTLVWQQNSQNFVIASGNPPIGEHAARPSTLTGYLENPGHNSFQSGVRVLSGWVCDADTVELAIGAAGRQVAAYGTERLDTQGACGDTDNGFGLLFNWNLLGDGEHEVVAYVDDVELGRATVRVTTLGVEFVRDVEGECVAEDFPMPGETVLLEWQQNSQNFVITAVE